MRIKLNKQIMLFWALFIITLSASGFLVRMGWSDLILYAGFFLLLIIIYREYFGKKIQLSKLATLFEFIVVLCLLSIGITLQTLTSHTRINLLLSMFIIASMAVMAKWSFNSFKCIRTMSYAILAGTIAIFIIAVSTNTSVITNATDSIVAYGFNGGFEHKNYYSITIIAVFCGIFLCNKFSEKSKNDRMLLWVLAILVFLSNSRGGYMVFLLFMVLVNYDMLQIIQKRSRYLFLFIILAFGITFAINFYGSFVSSSASYLYRVTGLINYLDYYEGDRFHLIFGNAEMAFRETGLTYNQNIRSIIGYNGTVELTALNILVKNGIIGFFAYAIIFSKAFWAALKTKNWAYKITIYSILGPLLLSSLVETFMVNVHIVYAPFCYCILAGFCGICEKENRN